MCNSATLDSDKGKVIAYTKSRHKLCQCTGVCNFEKVNGSSSGDYGFLPLQPLGKIIEKGSNLGLNMGYVDLHKQFGHSCIPNCVGSQYSIPTDLNILLWEELLTGNRDHQLISFLKYGFPLDIPQLSEFEPNTVNTNHYNFPAGRFIEEGRLNWQDLCAVQKVRESYSYRAHAAGSHDSVAVHTTMGVRHSSSAAGKTDMGTALRRPCRNYNSGTCRQEFSHLNNGFLYEHFCTFCATKVFKHKHSEQNCRSKDKS